MTTRIDRRMGKLKQEGRPALVTYFMGGDPDYATSLSIMQALPGAGADIIELGVPFSDPMADGPAIQADGLRALKGGQTLKRTLSMAAEFRKGDDETPIVLMGYYNPIYIYGVDRFLADAKAAGIDGLSSSTCAVMTRNCASGVKASVTSFGWPPPRPTTSACPRCCRTPPASSTTCR